MLNYDDFKHELKEKKGIVKKEDVIQEYLEEMVFCIKDGIKDIEELENIKVDIKQFKEML